MKNPLIHSKGITLLEILLVLVIASSILLMSGRFYNRYRIEQDFVQIQNNVDILFQSLRMFYQTNCQKGLLSPLHDPPVDTNVPFLINNEALFNENLISNGFLSNMWPAYNLRVDNTFGYQGYSVKLNPKLQDPVTRYVRACYQGVCEEKGIPNRKILMWQFEIAVKVNDVDYAQSYGPYIGAQCIVENVPDDGPVNCTTDNSPEGQILVWQLMPSDPFLRPRSDAWLLNPVVENFNILYTHDPMYELYNPYDSKNPNPDILDRQYYLCGG